MKKIIKIILKIVTYIVVLFILDCIKEEEMNILQMILSYLIPTILGAILGFIATNFKKNKQKDLAIEQGVQALLRNEIIRRYREFESKGEISILDKENLEEMFEQYKNLGGNGTVKKMMDELLNLKTKIIK